MIVEILVGGRKTRFSVHTKGPCGRFSLYNLLGIPKWSNTPVPLNNFTYNVPS